MIAAEGHGFLPVGWALAIGVLLIIANGVFVAFEFAVIAARRSAFESGAENGRRTDRLAADSMKDLSLQLAGAQFGITMATLGLGSVAEPALATVFENWLEQSVGEDLLRVLSFMVALGIVTFLHLVIGEMVPKNIAIAAPEPTVRWLVLPYRAYLLVFGPVVRLLNFLAAFGTRLFGVEPADELAGAHSTSELTAIVIESSEGGAIDDESAELLQGALGFTERTVGDVVEPLDLELCLPADATGREAEEMVRRTRKSRIPVVAGESRTVPRYLHAKDLLKLDAAAMDAALPPELLRPTMRVRAGRPLVQAITLMRQQHRQLAVVIDDAGSIGVVSVEELTEALVSEGPTPVAT